MANHTRTFEFVDVVLELDGYSARAIREIYTHIIGTSRLQASTRYINYENMDYFIPPKISNNSEALKAYTELMEQVKETYKILAALDIPQEDTANILPLGHTTKIAFKINARALIHLAHLRLCSRAYHEVRQLIKDIKQALSELDNREDGQGWDYIAYHMTPKCVSLGYCDEAKSCGIRPLKKEII
jgi:thymidylate synthase (FAD)